VRNMRQSERKLWNGAPIATRIYSGRREEVFVKENGASRPLITQAGESNFSWGPGSRAGKKRLAMALLSNALEDENRASELADGFTARVVSILPERWHMTRERVLAYADVMAREKINELLIEARSSFTSKPI
jgi:hypothetical protein